MKFIFSFTLLLLSSVCFAQTAQSYILGAGDKVEIKVFGQTDLEVTALLGNSGEVNYPFLGKVKLAGLNTSEVEQVISQGLKPEYLINPMYMFRLLSTVLSIFTVKLKSLVLILTSLL